ncbi:MAG: hypothetical protein ACHQM6_08910 [Candidatus Kapaibacterium sp.]
MKRYFLLFGSFFFLIFPGLGKAQELRPGGWSIAVWSGGQYSLSSSMHGDIGQYEAALAGGKTSVQYPFGSNQAFSMAFGAQVEYRIEQSQISWYASGYGQSFNAGYGFRGSTSGRFTMTILSTAAGIQYTLGQTYQTWNFYGRVGIVPSIISGSNRSGNGNRFFYDSLRVNSVDSRFGMEVEFGERFRIPRWPIGIEASINYTNVNLFGKSYTAPVSPGALFGVSASINDGKNPSDANDAARTIDFLSLRIGARIYFYWTYYIDVLARSRAATTNQSKI